MTFAFANTHAYPGCRVRLLDAAGPALAEFSDGTVAPAQVVATAPEMMLAIGAYVTRAGTRVPARTWLLRGAPHGFVVARATG